jgi:hypothetical protein
LCPLEGRAYIYLAELSSLCGAGRAGQGAYLEQAVRLRPFDGIVLSASANQVRLAGDASLWWDYLKRAFRCGHRRQFQIMGNLVASSSAEELPGVIDDILRECQPDLDALRFLSTACAGRCSPQQLTALARRRAEKAESEAARLDRTAAAALWLEAHQLRSALGDDDARTAQCIRNALQCDPNNYDVRYLLAVYLLGRGEFAEAETHFQWCLHRTPDNPTVESKLQEAVRGQLDSGRRTAKESRTTINR